MHHPDNLYYINKLTRECCCWIWSARQSPPCVGGDMAERYIGEMGEAPKSASQSPLSGLLSWYRAVSLIVTLRFVQRSLEQVGNVQLGRPVPQVGQVESISLHLQDALHV